MIDSDLTEKLKELDSAIDAHVMYAARLEAVVVKARALFVEIQRVGAAIPDSLAEVFYLHGELGGELLNLDGFRISAEEAPLEA